MSSILNADTSNGLKITSDTSGEIKLQSAGTDTVTVDTSGNVLIGKTSVDYTTVGFESTPSSIFQANAMTGDGVRPLLMARKTNDGELIQFRRDTTQVGSIGAASGGIYFGSGTSSTERMRIDSSGRVTTPNQPSFLATINGSNISTTGTGTKVPFNYTLFNIGNNFSTSTNTFTCPVAGRYMFMWQGYQNGTQTLRLDLYVNGTRYVGGHVAAATGDGFASSVLLNASANDAVTIVLETPTTTLFYGGTNPHTYFTGHLLG